MKQDRRGSWYLLTGIVFGIAVGLVYSWVISPVRYVDAPPSALRSDYKDDYRALIAAAYLYNLDLVRAEDRLAQLKDDDAVKTLTMQAQRALSEGHSKEEINALNTLSSAISGNSAPGIKESTPVPEVNLIPMPDKTSPTSLLINRLLPLIKVEVQDAKDQPLSGVEVMVLWESGDDHLFIGLHPELGMGYAVFAMYPGLLYSNHLASDDSVESNFTTAKIMAEDISRYWGSRVLIFTQT